jgi:subtilisin family serine protease
MSKNRILSIVLVGLAVLACAAAGPALSTVVSGGSDVAPPGHGHKAAGVAEAGATAVSASSQTAALPGRVIVKYKADVSAAAMDASAAQADARVITTIRGSRSVEGSTLAVVRSNTQSATELVAVLEADPRVAYAEPDYLLDAYATPNDPSYASLWGMTKISAPAAWDLTTGSSSVVVADIDTGVDYTHADLAANMWHNPLETPGNGVDDDHNGWVDDVYGIDPATAYGNHPDGDPMDDHGHGTHTSGTIAAVGNNSVGVAGVCWQARIMALRFMANNGSGGASGYTSDAIICVNYVIEQKVNHGVNVAAISASWGGGSYSAALYEAIKAAGDAGIVFAAAAGNGGGDGLSDDNDDAPQYPSSYDCANIISIAATTSADALTTFSNYGVRSVDLAAPGQAILSTVPTFINATGYVSWNGTSMATPHVAGAVALAAAQFPADSMGRRISRVLSAVDPVAGLNGKCVTGGRLNVNQALRIADDDIPGMMLPASPVAETLAAATDVNDVYRVSLTAGQTLTASVTGQAGTDFGLYLFPPGTANVSSTAAAVAQAAGGAYPRSFSYLVPATGIYYLDVRAASGSGTYALSHSIVWDNDIPGVPAPSSPIAGTLAQSTDTDDVFSLQLGYGQTISSSLAGPAVSDYRLYLYEPSHTSVWDGYALAWADTGGYPRSISYMTRTRGTHYLDAYVFSGSGAYTLTYAVSPAGADDNIPGVALPASPAAGTVGSGTDWGDLYSFTATAGQSIQFSLTGAAGTDFDTYLFPPGTATVEGQNGTVKGAWGTSYPDAFTYTAASAGTYYLLVWAKSGTGTYSLAHNIPVDVTAPTTTLLGLTATGWMNHDVTLTMQATDDITGVARIEYQLSAGAWTTYTAPVVVSAEGEMPFSYRAIDNAGNTEAAKSATVRIDKTGPTTTASNKVSVKKGKKATFRFSATDRTATAKFTIKIFKGKKLKKSLTVGSKPCGSPQSYAWKRCTLAKGSYTWKVYATDEAGNLQSKIGSKGLTVK